MRNTIVKIILFALGVAMPLVSTAQRIPDDRSIFEEIINSESPYYYPSLMIRYNAGDTTLTADDYYYLYYGFPFADNYRPLRPIPAEDKVLDVFSRAQDSPTYEDMLDIIRYATETMKDDPFGPRNLNFLVYAYGAIGDTINERINYEKMTKVLSTIESSGTGKTEKSPMYVIRLSHASDVLASYGFSVVKRLIVSRTTEYVTVEDNEGKQLPKGYYFNFGRVYKENPEDAPKPEQRWKINDYPIGGYK